MPEMKRELVGLRVVLRPELLKVQPREVKGPAQVCTASERQREDSNLTLPDSRASVLANQITVT